MNITAQGLVAIAVIGLIAGWLASLLLGGSGGLIRYLIIGVIGSFAGGMILNAVGINLGIRNAFVSQVATATIGAVVVLAIARIIS